MNENDLKLLKLALYKEIQQKYKHFGYQNLSNMFDNAIASVHIYNDGHRPHNQPVVKNDRK